MERKPGDMNTDDMTRGITSIGFCMEKSDHSVCNVNNFAEMILINSAPIEAMSQSNTGLVSKCVPTSEVMLWSLTDN